MYMDSVVQAGDKTVITGMIIRLEDMAVIPRDEGNLDYQQFLKWLDEGNDLLPGDPNIFSK
jgi:hypothetical protein